MFRNISCNKAVVRAFSTASVNVNNQIYNIPRAGKPVVGICLDGTSQDYIDAAVRAGKMPTWKKLLDTPASDGARAMFSALNNAAERKDIFSSETMPSFEDLFSMQASLGAAATAFPTYTNPNNVSIITGQPPSKTGICGNYYYDEAADKEVMMTSPELITCDSILGALHNAGVNVTIVTAKDKLRGLLAHQLPVTAEGNHIPFKAGMRSDAPTFTDFAPRARCLSVEALHHAPALAAPYEALVGSRAPGVYDDSCSLFGLELGLRLLERDQAAGASPAVYYLSTTDYLQHRVPPGHPDANTFFQRVDELLAAFVARGAVVGITADHGMNDKVGFDGQPRVVYLADELAARSIDARVVLPITDPYLTHHGALGGYATVYVADKEQVSAAMEALRTLQGVYAVLSRREAVKAWDLPSARIGDIVVVGDHCTALGTVPAAHDLSGLAGQRLRSHGCMDESTVPLFVGAPLKRAFRDRLDRGKARNYSLFEYLLNGVQGTPDAPMSACAGEWA